MEGLTLDSKQDDPPLEVDTLIWLLPLSVPLSPSPTAEDGRLDMVGRFPEDERFLVNEALLPAPILSFWYSMGDWSAAVTHRTQRSCSRRVLTKTAELRLRLLTVEELVLVVQEHLNVSHPDLLDVHVGGLQGETLRRAATRQDELTRIVIHAVLQAQVGHLPGTKRPASWQYNRTRVKCAFLNVLYLNTLLELVSRSGRPFPEQLAENNDLLEEEDPPLFGAGQDAGVLLRYKEGLLLQQFALTGQFALQMNSR